MRTVLLLCVAALPSLAQVSYEDLLKARSKPENWLNRCDA